MCCLRLTPILLDRAAPKPYRLFIYGTVLNDRSRPLRERLAEFGRAMAVDEAITDKAGLVVSLEFRPGGAANGARAGGGNRQC
jgi:hypothetical protein